MLIKALLTHSTVCLPCFQIQVQTLGQLIATADRLKTISKHKVFSTHLFSDINMVIIEVQNNFMTQSLISQICRNYTFLTLTLSTSTCSIQFDVISQRKHQSFDECYCWSLMIVAKVILIKELCKITKGKTNQ